MPIAVTPTVLWLLAGIVLCLMELFLPTAFVEFTMGISALIVALVSQMIPHFGVQIALWMGLSLILTLVTRRLLPKNSVRAIAEATEAETLTEILPGQAGRVLYEGGSWRAKCADTQVEIGPHQKVYVVNREGNTLIVVPQTLLHS